MSKNKKIQGAVRIVFFILLFAFWAELVLRGALEDFDLSVQRFFLSLRNPVLNTLGCALEYIGHWPLPAAVCIVFLVSGKTRFSYGIPMSCCVLTSVGMYELLKAVFRRPRPDAALWLCQEHGFSFPSGHTLNNMVFWIVFASLIGYYFKTNGRSLPIYKKDRSAEIYPKKKSTKLILQALLIAWPIIIGLSRILVGVHWPSDVVGSVILALAIINAGYLIMFWGRKNEA